MMPASTVLAYGGIGVLLAPFIVITIVYLIVLLVLFLLENVNRNYSLKLPAGRREHWRTFARLLVRFHDEIRATTWSMEKVVTGDEEEVDSVQLVEMVQQFRYVVEQLHSMETVLTRDEAIVEMALTTEDSRRVREVLKAFVPVCDENSTQWESVEAAIPEHDDWNEVLFNETVRRERFSEIVRLLKPIVKRTEKLKSESDAVRELSHDSREFPIRPVKPVTVLIPNMSASTVAASLTGGAAGALLWVLVEPQVEFNTSFMAGLVSGAAALGAVMLGSRGTASGIVTAGIGLGCVLGPLLVFSGQGAESSTSLWQAFGWQLPVVTALGSLVAYKLARG